MIVVTGASGFVGRHLVAVLRTCGHDVRAVVRPAPGRAAGEIVARLDHAQDWPRVLDGAQAVIHLAAHNPSPFARRKGDGADTFRRVNVDGTALLAEQSARAGVSRFILMSSIRVYGTSTGETFDETAPLHADDPYGKSKREGEAAVAGSLQASSAAWTILRPPMIYGRDGGGILALMEKAIRIGIPVPVGGDDIRRSVVFVGNVVDAVRACLASNAAAGRAFNVSDGPALSYRELANDIGSAIGRQPRTIRLPEFVADVTARLPVAGPVARRLLTSTVCDDRLIRTTLNWTPPVATGEGIGLSFARK